MEPSWGGFYNYYPSDPPRSFDRPQASTSSENSLSPPTDDPNQRIRQPPPPPPNMNQGQQGQGNGPPYLPPPPGSAPPLPHSSSSPHMALPPFSHAFYSSSSYHPSSNSAYHSPPNQVLGIGGTPFPGSSSAPAQQSGFGSGNMPFHPNGPSQQPGGGMQQHGGSPISNSGPLNSMSRGLPNPRAQGHPGGQMGGGPHSYSESPRLGPGPLTYSSSPGLHHLSPTSPTTHLIPPGVFSGTTSSSSSIFPSALRTPGSSSKRDRKAERHASGSPSAESWDGSDKSGKPIIGEETDEQPWGMPQDQYKALNPRDKKQVRNRIGARRFRAKRKDYVNNLESTLRQRDDEVSNLRNQVDSYRSQINELRSRLGMPILSPELSNSSSTPGLGLLVSHSGSDGWGDLKDD